LNEKNFKQKKRRHANKKMGMYHPTSGKLGLYYFREANTPITIPKHILIQMLKYEQELRSSDHVQKQYTQADGAPYELERITVELQRKVVEKFMNQIPTNTTVEHIKHEDRHKKDHVLLAMRNARALYKDDPEVNQLTYYFKYDRTKFGVCKEEELAPTTGFTLYDLDKKPFSLAEYYAKYERVVIFSGSYS